MFKKAFVFGLYIFPILIFIYMFTIFPLLVMSPPFFSPVFPQCIFSTIWFDFIILKNKILGFFHFLFPFLDLTCMVFFITEQSSFLCSDY